MDLPAIPQNFAQYAEEIKATAKETLSFKLKPAKDLNIWRSKVGGVPYLPLDQEYPCNDKGTPLRFLVQVNFSETLPVSGYPEKGILEFYIDGKYDGFRVLYFSIVDQDESKLHKDIIKYENQMMGYGPVNKDSQYSMEFALRKQYMPCTDYRFETVMSFEKDWGTVNQYNKSFSADGHRIGGYPVFTQTDPRGVYDNFEGCELLLQLDSEDFEGSERIMWGDLGVGGFFIRPEDLNKCDFTKVLFHYDWY